VNPRFAPNLRLQVEKKIRVSDGSCLKIDTARKSGETIDLHVQIDSAHIARNLQRYSLGHSNVEHASKVDGIGSALYSIVESEDSGELHERKREFNLNE
jgi:hypothetical protein